ncbi:tRNA pseudouridine(13) synthase TruD, partial [archaeon SCG-AAA382B04]
NNGDFVGGKIRQKPEDFVVKEKSNFDYIKKEPKEKDLDYLVVRVKAKNWDTNQLIKELSDQLGVSKKRISFAGTKDKRAITTQLFTFYKVKKQDLERIDLNNVEFIDFGYCKNQINIGDLVGNKFEIKLRNVDNPKRAEDIKKLLQKNGIINYYGPQRFGGIRPITHLVGEQIVR